MRISKTLMTGAVAAVAVAGSAMGGVIYDSTWMYQAGTVSPTATSGWNNNIVTHYTNAYAGQGTGELGGKIGFAGTDRYVQSATVQMRTGTAAAGAVAGNVTMSLNFYGVNGDGSIGSLLMSKTQLFATPASSGPVSNGWEWRPFFDVTFDLNGLGSLPDQVYWGLSLDPYQNSVAEAVNIGLFNYGTYPGASTANSMFDASVIKTGTDLSGMVWWRSLNGTTGAYSGFTPTMSLTAVPAPGAIALLGMAGLVGTRRRR